MSKVSRINLIDLAGSERSAVAMTSGERLKVCKGYGCGREGEGRMVEGRKGGGWERGREGWEGGREGWEGGRGGREEG